MPENDVTNTMEWELKIPPHVYLKRFPEGPHAKRAQEIVNIDRQEAEKELAVIDINKVESTELVKKEESLEKDSEVLVDTAEAIVVNSAEEDENAVEFIKLCRELLDQMEEYHRPNIKRWNEGHKAATKALRDARSPVEEAIKKVDAKRHNFRARIREEQRRQEEERQAALLEAERLEREKAMAGGVEEEPPWTEAMELRERALQETIEAMLIEPPKPEGTQVRVYWRWRVPVGTPVINGAPSNMPREFLCMDEKKINETVRALKQDAQAMIPGIEVFPEEQFAYTK